MPFNDTTSRTAARPALLRARTLGHALCAGVLLTILTACLSRSLTSLQISPPSGSVAAGQTSQFQAQGIFTESGHATTSQDVTSQVTWQSSNPSVATISATGLATGVATGTTTITGTMKGSFGQVSATATLTVTAATSGSAGRALTGLTLTPAAQVVAAPGQTGQFIAIGSYSGGSPATANLTSQVTWQSSDAGIAQVNSSGQVTGKTAGQATITALATATDGSVISASGTFTVTSAAAARTLASLALVPGNQTVATTGATAQFVAIGTYSSGSPSTADLTSQVTWRSSDAGVAQVNQSGLVTSEGAGLATITALATASDGSVISASSTLTVANPTVQRTLTSLTVIPANQIVTTNGETTQFIAIGTYNVGSPATADLTRQVAWQSSDVNVVQIDSSGLSTAVGVGQSTITALATAPDGSSLTAVGLIMEEGASGSINLPTLTIYNVGSGTGTVTGAANGNTVITCSVTGGASTGCVGNFPLNQSVTLTATPASGSHFDGWSLPCSPQPDTSSTCTITMTTNLSVGAIFDLTQ